MADYRRCFRFGSPELKRATGRKLNGRWKYTNYYLSPDYSEMPLYAPMVNCSRFAVVGAVPIATSRYKCRVRVWPGGIHNTQIAERDIQFWAPSLDYHWLLELQPTVRPACYEDDPMQAGRRARPYEARALRTLPAPLC